MKTKIFFYIFLFSISNLLAQEISFSEFPEDYRLYARDKTDSAEVFISATIKGKPDFKEFLLKVYKNDDLFDTKRHTLKNNKILIATKINSGLHEFKFEFYINKNNKDSLYLTANNVVCGDAYIITGQSNSHASSSLSTYSNPFCRSFGVKTGFESYNDVDKKVRWGLATGNCPDLKGIGGWFTKNPFGVGVWGMELMKLIVEKYQVPVCIINGGSGASSIEENMLYPDRPSLETSFGRLAYRLDQAGLKDKVKAIFWHQGEANSKYQQDKSLTEENYRIYSENFNILYKDWKRMYTGLEKIYLFQLHPGCGGEYQSEMREIQNKITSRYNMISIMSTNGVVGHDGCHFSYEGYCEFAQRIFPLVSRDFYQEKAVGIISPPQLVNASYSNPGEIILQFDQPLVLQDKQLVNGITHFIKDQFLFDQNKIPNMVSSATAKGNEIVLEIRKNRIYKSITYLPNKYYPNIEDIYEGPWIVGENNIAALSFDKREIDNSKAFNAHPLWNGYKVLDSTLNNVNFKIVFPEKANKNRDWIWRARFWGTEPQTDLALLEQGFHLVYVEVGGLFGNSKAIKIWDDFYDFTVQKYRLHKKVVLEGMSRGGLIVFNWGNQNADKVACIYADAPVCDFKSWPEGSGEGKGSPIDWEICLEQYGFTEQQAMEAKTNPIDHMDNIARQKVPVLCVVGDVDTVVPVVENSYKLNARLQELGWGLTMLHKSNGNHHPHSLKDPKPIVDFILMSTGNKTK